MSETLYIQINRNIEVDKRDITIGDVATLLCKNASVAARVKTIKLVSLPEVPKRRVCFSVMKVIELIQQVYPDLEVNNIGGSDFIVDYIRQKKRNKWLEWLMVAVVAVFVFVGSAYAIMAYNNDVNTEELFEKVYGLLGAGNYRDYKIMEITYALGLFSGIVIFYNHFAGRKFTGDPTPIQVEMDKYEADVDTCMIDRSNAEGREKSAK